MMSQNCDENLRNTKLFDIEVQNDKLLHNRRFERNDKLAKREQSVAGFLEIYNNNEFRNKTRGDFNDLNKCPLYSLEQRAGSQAKSFGGGENKSQCATGWSPFSNLNIFETALSSGHSDLKRNNVAIPGKVSTSGQTSYQYETSKEQNQLSTNDLFNNLNGINDNEKKTIPYSINIGENPKACRFPLYELNGIICKPLLNKEALKNQHAVFSNNRMPLGASTIISTKPTTRKASCFPHSAISSSNNDGGLNTETIDLSALSSATDIYKDSPVLRIFRLIHMIHKFLNDIIPTRFISPTYYEFEDSCNPNGVSSATPKSLFVHLRQLIHKSRIFLLSLENKLNANKLLDRKLYSECEQSVRKLNRNIDELDSLKHSNMDYNSTVFIGAESQNRGRHLELLLAEMSDNIRESNIFVHVFSWSVETKRKQLELSQMKGIEKTNNVNCYKDNRSSEELSSGSCSSGIAANSMAFAQTFENEKYDAEFKKLNKLKTYFEKQEVLNNLDNNNNDHKQHIELKSKLFMEELSDEEN